MCLRTSVFIGRFRVNSNNLEPYIPGYFGFLRKISVQHYSRYNRRHQVLSFSHQFLCYYFIEACRINSTPAAYVWPEWVTSEQKHNVLETAAIKLGSRPKVINLPSSIHSSPKNSGRPLGSKIGSVGSI